MAPKKLSKIHQRVLNAQSVKTPGQSTASINRQFNRLVENGMQIDRSGDVGMLADITQTWDDLNGLRQQLAETVMTFTGQVYAMINNADMLELLGDGRPQFDKLVRTFFADAQAFSSRIADLRTQHEHRTGKIETVDDYGMFTNLSLQYQNANDELNVLLAPTLSEMMMIVHEKVDQAQTATLLDPAVVSDVQVK